MNGTGETTRAMGALNEQERDLCAEAFERLISGDKPTADAALSEHVGSCLSCFRAAAELRELPPLAARMRALTPPDPGAAFWDGFSSQVADAWEARRGALRAATARRPIWSVLVRALQRPLPAAALGAAVATFVVYAQLEPHSSGNSAQAPAVSAQLATPNLLPETAVSTTELDVDLLESLDVAELRSLLDDVGPANSPGMLSEHETVEPSPAAELEQLDTEALRVLALELPRHI